MARGGGFSNRPRGGGGGGNRSAGGRVRSFEDDVTAPVPVPTPRDVHPATQHHDPNRYLGTVMCVNTEKGFSFIRDGENREYFAHRSVYSPPALFEDAAHEEGRMVVSFFRTETTKGWRAAGVRLASVQEAEKVQTVDDESRGNR